MAVRIIVDSASDILPHEAAVNGIVHLPMNIVFGQTEYKDAVTLSHREFYEKLIESDTMPTTCQIPPSDFAAAFEEVTAAGDTAVVITISGKLSGTYQSACIAASDFDGKIQVVDSESVSLGERILTQLALQFCKNGHTAEQIKAILDEQKKKIRLIALVDTLEYLKRGGRISSAVAFAGGLLSIKPVVAVENGEVVMVGKARGSKQGNNLLRELAEKSGIDFDKPCCLAYSGLDDSMLQKYIKDSASLWEGRINKLPIATVGCAIGTHVGPGAIAVAFFEETKE